MDPGGVTGILKATAAVIVPAFLSTPHPDPQLTLPVTVPAYNVPFSYRANFPARLTLTPGTPVKHT